MTEPTWMVVELMGRKVVAGLVREETRFGVPWMRIDVPDVPGQPGFTSYYGSSSLYGFRPVDEATARAVAAKLREPPVEPWRIAQLGAAPDSVRPGEDLEYGDDDESVYENEENDNKKDDSVDGPPCGTCHGEGSVFIGPNDDDREDCEHCDGTGVEPTAQMKTRVDAALRVLQEWAERLATSAESKALSERCFRILAVAAHDHHFFALMEGTPTDAWWAHLMHACSERVYRSAGADDAVGFSDALRRACFDEATRGTHVSHCCKIHGCKYGDWFCPLEDDDVAQENPEPECCFEAATSARMESLELVARDPCDREGCTVVGIHTHTDRSDSVPVFGRNDDGDDIPF